MLRISSGVLSGSPCLALRMNPGVSMIVRLGQCADCGANAGASSNPSWGGVERTGHGGGADGFAGEIARAEGWRRGRAEEYLGAHDDGLAMHWHASHAFQPLLRPFSNRIAHLRLWLCSTSWQEEHWGVDYLMRFNSDGFVYSNRCARPETKHPGTKHARHAADIKRMI